MSARVLLVDDEAQVRNALERALRRAGYEVMGVASGESAYAILEQTQIDVVLLDLVMPQLSGEVLLVAMLRRWPYLEGRVILMTGHPEATRLEWPEELRRCRVLFKPFGLDELYSTVSLVAAAGRDDGLDHASGQS
jgi:DNA-binding NtrC family response regulator